MYELPGGEVRCIGNPGGVAMADGGDLCCKARCIGWGGFSLLSWY